MRTPLRRPRERAVPTRAQLAGLALVTAFLAIAAPAAFTDQASAKAQRPPKVAELDYFKQSGEPGPATRLEAYGRRIDSLKFKTGYAGQKATAAGREFKPVTSHRFGHPWIPDPDNGRRALLNVIKGSIEATGKATREGDRPQQRRPARRRSCRSRSPPATTTRRSIRSPASSSREAGQASEPARS